MKKMCSSKHDAAFTSSPPTEFVMYDYSKMLFPIDIWQRELEPWRRDLFFRGLLRFWTTFCLISYQSGHHFRINSACQSHVKRWGTVTLFWLLSAALYCSLSLYPSKRHLLFCLVSMDTHVIRPRHHRTLHISVVSSLSNQGRIVVTQQTSPTHV